MEGAFLGLEGPPFPGCPAGGRVFWGCLGKGRLRLAPTGRSACLSLCPRPLLTFWKTTLKKGLPAHSAWDPRVLGGEEPPEGVQFTRGGSSDCQLRPPWHRAWVPGLWQLNVSLTLKRLLRAPLRPAPRCSANPQTPQFLTLHSSKEQN